MTAYIGKRTLSDRIAKATGAPTQEYVKNGRLCFFWPGEPAELIARLIPLLGDPRPCTDWQGRAYVDWRPDPQRVWTAADGVWLT